MAKRRNRLIGFNLFTVLLLLALVGLAVFVTTRCGGPRQTTPAPTVTPVSSGPRIVSLSPAIAIILRDLKMDDRIVGRDSNDMVLDRSVPICGDQAGLDYEAILRARPTHVFLQWGARELPPRLTELARQHGWTVNSYGLLTLDEIAAAVADLRKQLEPTPAGSSPGPLEQAMQHAWSRRGDGFASVGRVLLLESIDPPAAFGPGSFHQQALERIGGTPALTQGNVFITMDIEPAAGTRCHHHVPPAGPGRTAGHTHDRGTQGPPRASLHAQDPGRGVRPHRPDRRAARPHTQHRDDRGRR
jgi:ABC-type hemin transport system substrate-binding protein